MRDLGTLGGDSSLAEAINASGQVVGESTRLGGTTNHAFVYRDGTMVDLNSYISANSGWTLIETARTINDSGQIVGQGTINGETHAYLMTPVPIPGAFWMFLPGLVGIHALSSRKHGLKKHII